MIRRLQLQWHARRMAYGPRIMGPKCMRIEVCMKKYVLSTHTEQDPPMEATVAERGQITLPKAVRDALGLTKGSVLKIELEGSRIVLRKSVDDAISRARGRFKLDGFASTDAAMQAVRGHALNEASEPDAAPFKPQP